MQFMAVKARRPGAGAQAPRDRAVHEGDRPEAGGRRAGGRAGGAAGGRRGRGPPATGPTAAEDAAANQAVGAPVPEGELALQNVGAIGTYPGDNASQAELAQVARRRRPRRPACRPSCR